MKYFELKFEAKDRNGKIHRLLMYPELKVYRRGVVAESDEDSVFFDDISDMNELEHQLFSAHYIAKIL